MGLRLVAHGMHIIWGECEVVEFFISKHSIFHKWDIPAEGIKIKSDEAARFFFS